MCMKQERERLEVWLKKEMRMKSNTKIVVPLSEVKVVEEELLDRCIVGSGIF